MLAVTMALLIVVVGLAISIALIKLVSLTPDWFIDWVFTHKKDKK